MVCGDDVHAVFAEVVSDFCACFHGFDDFEPVRARVVCFCRDDFDDVSVGEFGFD